MAVKKVKNGWEVTDNKTGVKQGTFCKDVAAKRDLQVNKPKVSKI